jgi:hypothetical protein
MKLLTILLIPIIIYSQEKDDLTKFKDRTNTESMNQDSLSQESKIRFGFSFGTIFIGGNVESIKSHFMTNLDFLTNTAIQKSGTNIHLGLFLEGELATNFYLTAGLQYMHINELKLEVDYDYLFTNEGVSHYHYTVSNINSFIPLSAGLKVYAVQDDNNSLFIQSGLGLKIISGFDSELRITNEARGTDLIDRERDPLKDENLLVFTFGAGYKYKNLAFDISYSPSIYSFVQEQGSDYFMTGKILEGTVNAFKIGLTYMTD